MTDSKFGHHSINPSDVAVKFAMLSTFGFFETEKLVQILIQYCLQRGNTWQPIPVAELLAECAKNNLPFNWPGDPLLFLNSEIHNWKPTWMWPASDIVALLLAFHQLIVSYKYIALPDGQNIQLTSGFIEQLWAWRQERNADGELLRQPAP